MNFFINALAETDNLDKIKELDEIGVLDGVFAYSTSCSDLSQFIADMPEYFNGTVISEHTSTHAEYTATNYAQYIIKEKLAVVNENNVAITMPFTQDGLRAYKALTEQEIQTNISCCSIVQALLATRLEATYISIPADPLNNKQPISDNRISLIKYVCDIYKKRISNTRILLTSINSLHQVEQVACIGVHTVVIPSSMFSEIIPS